MPNTDWPCGLKPAGNRHTGRDGPVQWFGLTTTNAVGKYSPIVLAAGQVLGATAGDGNDVDGTIVALATADGDGNRVAITEGTVPMVAAGASGTYFAGVILGGNGQLFEIQAATGGTALAEGDINENAVLASVGVDTTTGISTAELSTSTAPANDASYQLRIVGIRERPDNAWGDNVNVLVELNATSRAVNDIGTA